MPPSITAGPSAAPLTIDSAATAALSVSGFDPDGDPLTYSWTATGGRIDGTGSAVTYRPPVVSAPTTCRITVFVADGRGGIASNFVDVTVTPSTSPQNVAGLATATASSEANGAHRQIAAKAIDGIVGGYPTDAQREWASSGELAGAWIQLTWTTPVTISRSVLHDRINTSDQILSGTLRFSDGSSLLVGALPDDGVGLTTDFSARTVTWIRFEVASARGGAVGLAEWEVFTTPSAPSNAPPQITAGPTATPATINDLQTSTLSVSATDADGDPLTYSWIASGGSISGAGATVTFTPPRVTSSTSFRIDVQIADGRGSSTTGFVIVNVTPQPNTSPQISAGPTATPATISVGQTSSLSVSATDANGDPLTYAWVASGGSISGSGATVTFTPPAVTSTTSFRIDVNVTDGRGGSVTGFVNVSVTGSVPRVIPEIRLVAPGSVTPGAVSLRADHGGQFLRQHASLRQWAAGEQRRGRIPHVDDGTRSCACARRLRCGRRHSVGRDGSPAERAVLREYATRSALASSGERSNCDLVDERHEQPERRTARIRRRRQTLLGRSWVTPISTVTVSPISSGKTSPLAHCESGS